MTQHEAYQGISPDYLKTDDMERRDGGGDGDLFDEQTDFIAEIQVRNDRKYTIECPSCARDDFFALSPESGCTYICFSCGREAVLGPQLTWKVTA